MKGRMGTIRPYRKRSMKRPIATVARINVVFDRHFKPIGFGFVSYVIVPSVYFACAMQGNLGRIDREGTM